MDVEQATKKVLVLNGSPHKEKSTTMMMTNAFVHGMVQTGKYTAQTIHIADLKIIPCKGCLSCWGRTEGECVIKQDDIPALKQKIIESDVVISSFPLYFFEMPGQMKVMTDRLLSMVGAYHGQLVPTDGAPAHELRYPKPGRKLILISGCAYTKTEDVYKPLLLQYDLICGKQNYIPILCPQLKTMIDNGGGRVERTVAKFVSAGEEFANTGALCEQTLHAITRPPFSKDVYQTILENVWRAEREKGKA